jgi:Holliday junction resolvase RusA-like endonuclease
VTGTVEFVVLGRPQPAGSKRSLGPRRIVDTNAERLRPWKDSIMAAAVEQLDGRPPLTGPLALHVVFYVARPQGHYGTGRNAHLVKASAPRHPTVRPDCTKLLRGLEDALTDAGVWNDDAQVVVQHASKRYGRPERCEVIVQPAPAE